MSKPHLKLVEGQPITVSPPKSPAVLAAQEKYGRPFLAESGSPLRWTSGPTVLTAWLHDRQAAKKR